MIVTDYPYDVAHDDMHRLPDAVPGLSEAERSAILGANAARLLDLPPALRPGPSSGRSGGARG